jgi:hypothetical protein
VWVVWQDEAGVFVAEGGELDAGDAAGNLIGHAIVAVGPLDPRWADVSFALSGGGHLELRSDRSGWDSWSFHHDDLEQVFVGCRRFPRTPSIRHERAHYPRHVRVAREEVSVAGEPVLQHHDGRRGDQHDKRIEHRSATGCATAPLGEVSDRRYERGEQQLGGFEFERLRKQDHGNRGNTATAAAPTNWAAASWTSLRR